VENNSRELEKIRIGTQDAPHNLLAIGWWHGIAIAR
jgi:hypothetical protein